MDLCLYGRNTNIAPADLAPLVELDESQVERVYKMIDAKRKMAHYLHATPSLVE